MFILFMPQSDDIHPGSRDSQCQISSYKGFNRGKLESLFFRSPRQISTLCSSGLRLIQPFNLMLTFRAKNWRTLLVADKLGKAIAWHLVTLKRKRLLSDSLHFILDLVSVCILYPVCILYWQFKQQPQAHSLWKSSDAEKSHGTPGYK